MLLKDSKLYPDDTLLKSILDREIFDIYKKIDEVILEKELNREWRFYKDGNSWLCKVTNKKKTIFWLSVWDGFIKTSFYFTQKSYLGILNLDIDERVKNSFSSLEDKDKKLIPLILDITKKEELKDFSTIIDYKKSLK